MSPPELFEKLNILGKLIRENKGAFGTHCLFTLIDRLQRWRLTRNHLHRRSTIDRFGRFLSTPSSARRESASKLYAMRSVNLLRLNMVNCIPLSLTRLEQVSRGSSRYLLKKLAYLTKKDLPEFQLQTSSSVSDRKSNELKMRRVAYWNGGRDVSFSRRTLGESILLRFYRSS